MKSYKNQINILQTTCIDISKNCYNLLLIRLNIDYLSQISQTVNHDDFFARFANTRQSLNEYPNSLHTKFQPLDKSPFEIFGELLRKERQGVPDINIVFTNFGQWNPARLNEARDLLNELANFLSFFRGERTTIWDKSSIQSYSYQLELEVREKIDDFLQVISDTQNLNQNLQRLIEIPILSHLEDLESYYPVLVHITQAPNQLPENWTQVDISTAREAFDILQQDVQEIERKQLSREGMDLLRQLSSLVQFLRGEKTTIWSKSKLSNCSQNLERELHQQLDNFQQELSQLQTDGERLKTILNLTYQPLLTLEDIEASFRVFQHILNIPSDFPVSLITIDLPEIENAFTKLKNDIKFLAENEPSLRQSYHSELFSAELPALNNRFQRYNRFWIMRIFNAQYRKDIRHLKNIRIHKGRISFNQLKCDLLQAVQVQATRNNLYKNDYPARIFGSLFNPEFSHESELENIEQVFNWANCLKQYLDNYSLSNNSLEIIINNPHFRQEISGIVGRLEVFPESFERGLQFLRLHFCENDIVLEYYPQNKILLTELLNFVVLAKNDLSQFDQYLSSQNICKRLEELSLQDFVDALRDNRPNPIVVLRNKLSQSDYLPGRVFGYLFNPQFSQITELQLIVNAVEWLVNLSSG